MINRCRLPANLPALLALAGWAIFAAGCSFRPATPPEFAAYPRGWVFKGPFRAVSPDGVVFTVRSEKNKPKADLAFWKQALRTRMEKAGYRVVGDTLCAMQGRGGALLQLAAPVGNQDYLYWIAFSLSPDGDNLLVAEAAGESKRFLARRADIAAAIDRTGW